MNKKTEIGTTLCRLCISRSDSDVISIFDENKIAEIIAKHFSFQPTLDEQISEVICLPCWTRLEVFHEFYTIVEDAQEKLKLTNCMVTTEEPDDSNKNSPVPFCKIYVKEEGTTTDVTIIQEITSTGSVKQECKEGNLDGISIATQHEDQSIHLESGRFLRKRRNRVIGDVLEEHLKKKQKKAQPIKKDKERLIPKKKDRKFPRIYKTKMKFKTRFPEYTEKIKKYMPLLKCMECGHETQHFSYLEEHYKSVHQKKGGVMCCNKIFYRIKVLADHFDLHDNPESFKCQICEKTFGNSEHLEEHVARHAPENERPFQCDKCPKKFALQKLLRTHRKRHNVPEERNYSCNLCDNKFQTPDRLEKHQLHVHEKAFATICHLCSKELTNVATLKKHINSIHGDRAKFSQQCEDCGLWFKQTESYKNHKRTKHAADPSNAQEFVCKFCAKTFPDNNAAKYHEKRMHIEPDPKFQCPACGKFLKSALSFKEHMAWHRGEKLYECPHCKRRFFCSSNRATHVKKMHPIEWSQTKKGTLNYLLSNGGKHKSALTESEYSVD